MELSLMKAQDRVDFFGSGGDRRFRDAMRMCMRGDLSGLDQMRLCDDTVRPRDWETIAQAVQTEGEQRLTITQDLLSGAHRLGNPMATLSYGYDAISSLEHVHRSLDGETEPRDDRQVTRRNRVPVPIIGGGLTVGTRHLEASRVRGEGLDVTGFREMSILIANSIEDMIFGAETSSAGVASTATAENWGDGALSGLLNYSGQVSDDDSTSTRNEQTRSTDWNAATTDENKLAIRNDISAAITTLKRERFYGPYAVYVPYDCEDVMDADWKANSALTVRQRLLQRPDLLSVRVSDRLPLDHYIVADISPRSMQFIDGLDTQVVRWTSGSGMVQHFFVFAIASFIIRQSYSGRTGYVVIES